MTRQLFEWAAWAGPSPSDRTALAHPTAITAHPEAAAGNQTIHAFPLLDIALIHNRSSLLALGLSVRPCCPEPRSGFGLSPLTSTSSEKGSPPIVSANETFGRDETTDFSPNCNNTIRSDRIPACKFSIRSTTEFSPNCKFSDLVFNLDDVGISEREDRKPKQVIASQAIEPIRFRLEETGMRVGRDLVLRYCQKPSVMVSFSWITSKLCSDLIWLVWWGTRSQPARRPCYRWTTLCLTSPRRQSTF
jgi:hypothetical protein